MSIVDQDTKAMLGACIRVYSRLIEQGETFLSEGFETHLNLVRDKGLTGFVSTPIVFDSDDIVEMPIVPCICSASTKEKTEVWLGLMFMLEGQIAPVPLLVHPVELKDPEFANQHFLELLGSMNLDEMALRITIHAALVLAQKDSLIGECVGEA